MAKIATAYCSLWLLVAASNNGVVAQQKTEYKKDYSTASIFSMEFLPIGHLRTDPILSQKCLSEHVHTFYGPPKIHPAVTYEELRSTTDATPFEATSGNVLENQSLYWHPTFYRVLDDGTREITEPDWTTVYYAFNKGETKAFPEGFRMIARPGAGLRFSCYGTKSEKKDDTKEIYYENDSADDTANPFPAEACAELATSLVFPSCWDGENLDSVDHASHVAYPVGKESGDLSTFAGSDMDCPESHPVLLPQILLFFRFLDYPGGEHELSNSNGNGGAANWHADYMMGWDEGFLQEILDGADCETNSKDVPCGATRLRNIRGTGGGTKGAATEWHYMAETLRLARVPMVESACITDEPVDGISVPPRGGCMGDLLSADSCEQPKFPADLLGGGDEGGKDAQGVSSSDPQRTFFVAFLGTVLCAVLAAA